MDENADSTSRDCSKEELDLVTAGRFRALFEHMQEGVAIYEIVRDERATPIDCRVVETNEQFEKHTGLSRSECIGRLATEIYGADATHLVRNLCAVGTGAKARRVEFHEVRSDRYFDISVAPLGQNVLATLITDVTLSKKQAEALEKSRLHQRALLDNQPHLAWLKDREGRFLAVNQAFARACGRADPEAVVGRTDLDVWPTQLAAMYRADDDSVMHSGRQKAVEEEIADVEGTRWFETYKSPVYAPAGNIVGTTGVSRDITARKEAELARAQSERKFEQVFDLAPDPILVATIDGEVLYANRAFCATLGFSREEVVGNRMLALGIWEDPTVRQRATEILLREGRLDAFEVALLSRVGKRHIMEVSGVLTEMGGRKVVITAARNVTAHRHAETRARVAAESLERYFEISLDLLCITDRESRFVRLNPAWEVALGIPVSQLKDTQFLELVHPDDLSTTVNAMRDLDEGLALVDFQSRFRHADGSWRWLEWRSVADAHGRVYAVARDVTRRHADELALRAAERAAAKSRERLLSVSELAHIGHFTFHLDSSKITWTAELYRIFGVDPLEFEPTVGAVRAMLHPEDLHLLDDAMERLLEKGVAQRRNFRLIRPSGEIRHCLLIAEDVSDENSSDTSIYGLVQDLTELRRAENEQRKLEQQVMQAQKLESLGVLAGGIAHDFNNLLTSILGNTDLALSDLPPTHPACVYLEDVVKVSRRAADLCRQMLAYSGKGRFVIQALSLNDVVREMAQLLSVSISKKVTIEYDFSPSLPSVMVDATQIRQVVMNLITNASEAIGDAGGRVTLATGVVDCDEAYLSRVVRDNDQHEPGAYVFLDVSDTGCGMPRETLSRIFEPFFTTKFTGRGLGLAAVMGIVRGHKGALRVETEVGKGTSFRVLLPAHEHVAEQRETTGLGASTWRGRGLVLLVDDETSIRRMGRHLLERAGFEVVTAADGCQAVELFARHRSKVRVVVLDVTMPQLDGEACFRELRHIDPYVRVIMTSGYNEQDIVERFAGKGLSGFVQKPYQATDLLHKIRMALGE